MRITSAWLTLSMLLAACGPTDAERRARAHERQIAADRAIEVKLAAAPATRSYSINGNQLLVIQVPTKTSWGTVDLQHCFVWRDFEMKTGSLSCPAAADTLPAE